MRRAIYIFISLALAVVVTLPTAQAQRVAISSNALELLTLSPNLSGELVIAPKSSITLDITIDPDINVSDKYYLHNTCLRYGYRHWFKQALYSHFVGVNAVVSSYSVGIGKKFDSGNLMGIGATYGYSWVLSDRWNLVPTIGVGFAYVSHNIGACDTNIIPMVTDIGVRLQYVIK